MLRRSKAKSKYPSAAQLRERQEWAEQFDCCWICGTDKNLQTHEIASRARAPLKWAHPSNYFRACDECNGDILNYLCEPLQLAYKRIRDPDWYDREFVNAARGRAVDVIGDGEIRLWERYLLKRSA